MLAQDDSLHRGASKGGRWEEIWVLWGASRMPAPSSTLTCMLAQDDSLHREGPVKAADGRKSGSYGAHPACPPPVQRTRACWRRTTACTEGPVKAGDGRKNAHVHVGAGRQPAQRGASKGGRWEEIWVLWGASRMPAPSSTLTCMLAQDDSLHRRAVKAGDGRKSGSYGAHPACAPPVQRTRACWRRTTACTEGPVKAGDGRKSGSYGHGAHPACPLPVQRAQLAHIRSPFLK